MNRNTTKSTFVGFQPVTASLAVLLVTDAVNAVAAAPGLPCAVQPFGDN